MKAAPVFYLEPPFVCCLQGVPSPRDLPVENVGRQRTGSLHARCRAMTPPDVIARIEAMTTIDRELYAYARELFAQQHARLRARRAVGHIKRVTGP